MLVVSPGLAGNPGFDLISDAGANPGLLTYDYGPLSSNIATSIVRWDGTQANAMLEDISLDFDLDDGIGDPGFDATGMGMNNAFIWEGFDLDVADGGGSTFLKMRAYSGTSATELVSELILELNEDTIADLLIFRFDDFDSIATTIAPGDAMLMGADFTALTAIEFEIMAPGTTDVTLNLLESGDAGGNPSGPQDVPEPGMVMALATLGLTGLLAKRKKAN
ncbi:PEP-CTERM sorting domain-containing protein [Crocosphaera watsonii]|uniref:PEP-CTERM sorting domain-containing protein n=1 Tax=Crocosphaera watsonii TaxID=263511 RepID=UPI0030DB8DAB